MSLTPIQLEARLLQCLPAASEPQAAALAAALHASWSEAGRGYHKLQHLGECLAWLDVAPAIAEARPALTLALIFHDAIYDASAHDNEARSAEWAAEALPKLGAAPELTQKVCALVMATAGHAASPDAATALLLDIDLAILGAAAERFAEYEAGIRQEYAFVPEPEYAQARARVMRGFAQRERLYQTEFFHTALDAAARRNLAPFA